MKTKRRLVPKSVGSSSGSLPVEHSVVAQGCSLSTIHSHTPSVRPTVSTPCVRQLDASSDIRRLNELKRNVVDQDDHQVNLPSKKTYVCLLNSVPCIHQQSDNPVYINTLSTPVDDHDNHGHNDLYVSAEQIPISERGSQRPVTSLDSRLTSTVNTNTSQQRNCQTSTVNLSTSRQQPPALRSTSDYIYLESCTYSCQHCGTLFWGDERLKSVPRSSRPRYNRYRHFIENIRAYNQMFSMTSLGAQVDDSVNNGRRPYVFKISVQLYHWIGSLCPIEGETPSFLQLYIYDTDNEVDNRMTYFGGQNSDLRRDIVEGLIDLLDIHNRLVQLFRTIREKYHDTHVPNFKVRLYNVVGTREYKLPTEDMLSAIVYETSPESDMDYDIVLEERSGWRVLATTPCIRTVNDVVYPTCQAACEALGLLENDREWEITLEEAAFTATPTELRTLLAHILTFCQVFDPIKLWNRTWKSMSEDIPYTSSNSLNIPNLHIDNSDLEDYVLYEL
nr:helitron helicase-like domain-containing protein [Tanacetum cinerariifolium]